MLIMKILLANKFYYRRGGDCIVTMDLERILKEKGNEVAIYAMDYPENEDSPWKGYWPKRMSLFSVFSRPFGDSEVSRSFTRILEDFKPDVVHLHNIHTQLSPIIAEIAHERGIKVVWTLHDTKLVCPSYKCMRIQKASGSMNKRKIWCEDCIKDKTSVLKHRCMRGSLPGAIVGYLEQRKWNTDRLLKCTDLFLTPSKFMADICLRGGFPASRIKVLCNCIDSRKVKNTVVCTDRSDDYYAFLGRVTEVKGIRTLCAAASMLPYKLKVIGGGDLLEELQQKYSNKNSINYSDNIEFLGQLEWEELSLILKKAKFLVLPSEFSENNPLTVIESHSLGTPVLGARIGGIPELIEDEPMDSESFLKSQLSPNGMTFVAGDVDDLKNKIISMWSKKFDYEKIASIARSKYSSDAYYDKLIDIYQTL